MKRIRRHVTSLLGIAALMMLLASCSGNTGMSGGVGLSRSSSGDWGSSISFGIHSHGRGW